MIHERGGVATVKRGGDAPQIQVTPRGLVSDLASEIQRFKPALLELLTAPEPPATEPPTAPPFRRVNRFVWVPSNLKPAARGAVKICEVMQRFWLVFEVAKIRRRHRAAQRLEICLDGQAHEIEDVAAACLAIKSEWTEAARRCNHEGRDLTAPEAHALDIAADFLDAVESLWPAHFKKKLSQRAERCKGAK